MSGGPTDWDPSKTALLTIDLQNDFIHPEGAYGRAGQSAPSIAALPDRIEPVVAALRAQGWSVCLSPVHAGARPRW